MLSRLVSVGQSGVRVRTLGGSRAGEMRITRFLRNTRVAYREMIATATKRLSGRVRGRHILAIQDTTNLRDDGDQRSLKLHAMIAVDAANGALLGLLHAEALRRTGGLKALRHKRPFVEKESHRWLAATEIAAGLSAFGATCVTVIADREGDVYEEFACRPANVELLIRATQNRVLADGQTLFTCSNGLAELGRMHVDLPARPGRAARTAELVLHSRKVRLKRPARPAAEAKTLPAEVTLTLIEARELNPPVGVEAAHWRLLSTHRVTCLADAVLLIGFYRDRWIIEQLFRVVKTKGFDIEAVRIADPEPFEKLAVATLIAAVQVLQMVRDRDAAAGRPMVDVFDEADHPILEAVCATLEGKTERQKNPHPKATLAYAAWVCARLGGWTGYYGKPGPIVTLNGLIRYRAIAQGWQLKQVV